MRRQWVIVEGHVLDERKRFSGVDGIGVVDRREIFRVG